MRKWFKRISITLVVVIIAVIVIVQAVLWSPLPKRIVTEQIEKELGLRISCDTLTTGWLGNSELTNVSLGLPLSPADFLKVKALKIKHSSLIGLALGHVTVDRVEVDNPVVEVVQDAQGQWNLQQVAVLLGRLGGGNSTTPAAQGGQAAQSSSSGSKGVPTLPTIRLVDGTVHVTTNQNRQFNLSPLNVTGDPQGTLVWNYDLTISNSIALNGKVAPGGNWQHQLTLKVHELDPLVKSLGVASTYSANVDAAWYGQLNGSNLTGTLVLNQLTATNLPTVGDISVGGSISAESAGPVVNVHPNQLVIKTDYLALPELGIQSGTITSDATGIHAKALKVAAFGGLANLDGQFDPHSQAVDLTANWSGLSLAKKTSQSGSLTASLRQPFIGQPVINVDLISKGTVGGTTADALSTASKWDAKLNLTGQGTSWKSINWVFTAPQLTYATGAKVVNLSQLSAHVKQYLPVVELVDASLPLTDVTGGQTSVSFISSGKADFSKKNPVWNFDASGAMNASFQQTPVPITMTLHAKGDGERYDLTKLKIAMSDLLVTVDGAYDNTAPDHAPSATPVQLHVVLSQEKRILPDAPVQGELSGSFDIVGDLFKKRQIATTTMPAASMPAATMPATTQWATSRSSTRAIVKDPGDDPRFRPYLKTTGNLKATDLVLFGRTVGDVNVKLEGESETPDQPDEFFGRTFTQLKTSQFFLFQAPWTFAVDYPNPQGVLEVSVETHRLPLDDLARFAKMQGIGGQISSAKWVAKIPSLSLDDLDLRSDIQLEKVAAAGLTTDTVDVTTTLKGGVLQLNPLIAKSGEGKITTTASIDLKNPRHLMTETTVDHWPYELSSAVMAQLNAHTKLDVDLKAKQIGASGPLNASVDLLLKSANFAHADLAATISNRSIVMDTLEGNILKTGTFTGKLSVDLDKPLLATGKILWQNVDAATFATFIPSAEGLGGKYSGTITIGPAHDPRPLAPVRIDINMASTGGHFRTVDIGGKGLLTWHAVAYADTDRLVLDHSDLFVAGGEVKVWGRVDIRPKAGLAAQGDIEATNLQLDQLAHIDPSINKPMPGVVSAHITSIRSGPDVAHLLVLAHADLTQTDLANFGPIAALYNVMNAGGGSSPTGYGNVDISFEQNLLHVNTFRYFNRGIDARGLANIGPINYEDLPHTPIGGQVVGTVRALKGSNIKILSDFDQYFSALQKNLTTINVTGTIDNMSYPQAGLSDIGTAMRQLLVGDSRQGAGGQ